MLACAKCLVLISLGLVLGLTGCQPALTAEQLEQQASWQDWLAQENAQARDGRTSFLNIQDAHYLAPGEQVALNADAEPAQLRWQDSGDWVLRYPGGHQALVQGEGMVERALLPGEELALGGERFVTVGGLHDDGLRAFIRDPQHPRVMAFEGFDYFDYDPAARVSARFEALPHKSVRFQTIQGLANEVVQVGQVHFHYQGQSQSLYAYHSDGQAPFEQLLFFVKDATNGDSTYGGGRELFLETPGGIGETLVLDFNYLVNLYCAHSTFWNCPILWDPPLAVALEAGAKDPKKS